MKITDWPINDRPRERLLLKSASVLSDAELLSLIISTGVKGLNALDIARKTLDECGGLAQLIASDESALKRHFGLGHAKAARLLASVEIVKRGLAERVSQRPVFSDVESTEQYVRLQMCGLKREVFAVMMLNSQHHLIAFRKLFFGTINSASVHPRELVKQAMVDNAAAVILVHNHPSGVAEPSQSDISITHRISDAMQLVDVRVLDHFIVGQNDMVSLAQRNLLER